MTWVCVNLAILMAARAARRTAGRSTYSLMDLVISGGDDPRKYGTVGRSDWTMMSSSKEGGGMRVQDPVINDQCPIWKISCFRVSFRRLYTVSVTGCLALDIILRTIDNVTLFALRLTKEYIIIHHSLPADIKSFER